MNWIDAACLLILAVSALMGLWRGFVQEALGLAAWVAAFSMANWQAERVAQWLPMSGWGMPVRQLAAYALVLLATLMLMAVLSKLTQALVQSIGLGPLNRVLGVVFGLLRGTAVLMALVFVLTMTPWMRHPDVQTSLTVPLVMSGLQQVKGLLPSFLSVYLP